MREERIVLCSCDSDNNLRFIMMIMIPVTPLTLLRFFFSTHKRSRMIKKYIHSIHVMWCCCTSSRCNDVAYDEYLAWGLENWRRIPSSPLLHLRNRHLHSTISSLFCDFHACNKITGTTMNYAFTLSLCFFHLSLPSLHLILSFFIMMMIVPHLNLFLMDQSQKMHQIHRLVMCAKKGFFSSSLLTHCLSQDPVLMEFCSFSLTSSSLGSVRFIFLFSSCPSCLGFRTTKKTWFSSWNQHHHHPASSCPIIPLQLSIYTSFFNSYSHHITSLDPVEERKLQQQQVDDNDDQNRWEGIKKSSCKISPLLFFSSSHLFCSSESSFNLLSYL